MTHNVGDGFLFKTGLFAALAGLLYYFFVKNSVEQPQSGTTPTEIPAEPSGGPAPDVAAYLPAAVSESETVHHRFFSVGYRESHEQAGWVAWELTRDQLNQNDRAQRTNVFSQDQRISTASAMPTDYSGSGFDRGHLCPAGDRQFDPTAMEETFLMSNISPQAPLFNVGIWRELEELTRDWARKHGRIWVIAGPVLSDRGLDRIGASGVAVPKRFFRVIGTDDKAVAFVLPNRESAEPVMSYALSVDEAEKITGLDFFAKNPFGQESSVEPRFDPNDWPVDKQRFARRVEVWNLSRPGEYE